MADDPFKAPMDDPPAVTARDITEAEKAKRDAKTARLQEARLAKEINETVKPPIKTSKKRRWAPL